MIITEIQIIGLLLCAVLSLMAFRFRMPPLALVSSAGLFILGFQLFDASGDILILILILAVGVAQFILSFGKEGSK